MSDNLGFLDDAGGGLVVNSNGRTKCAACGQFVSDEHDCPNADRPLYDDDGNRVCRECGVSLIEGDTWPEHAQKANYYICRECHSQKCKERHDRIYEEARQRVFDKLGKKCVRCGFDDERALHVDHVNGGGAKHRRGLSSVQYYREIAANAEDYQILCANCNYIKKHEQREK